MSSNRPSPKYEPLDAVMLVKHSGNAYAALVEVVGKLRELRAYVLDHDTCPTCLGHMSYEENRTPDGNVWFSLICTSCGAEWMHTGVGIGDNYDA